MANEEPERTRVVLTEREIDEEDIVELIHHIRRVNREFDTGFRVPEMDHNHRTRVSYLKQLDIVKQLILDVKELSQKIVVFREKYGNIPDDIRMAWGEIREGHNDDIMWYNYQVEINPDLEPKHVVFGSGKPKRQLNGYKINVRL